jgi:uncharacterized protein YjiS (DUF1127 family)
MRNYTLTQAKFRADTWIFGALRLVLHNLRRRKALLKLEQLAPYQLEDIGLTPEDLHYLGRLPLTSDIDWERERLKLIASRRVSSKENK